MAATQPRGDETGPRGDQANRTLGKRSAKPRKERRAAPRKQRKWLFRAAVFFGLLIVLGAAAGSYGVFWLRSVWSAAPHGDSKTENIKIAQGTSFAEITEELHERDVISNGLIFAAYASLMGKRGSLQAGQYRIRTPITPEALLEQLQHGSFQRKLTVPEGWTASQIDQALLASGWIGAAGEWIAVVKEPVGAELAGLEIPSGAEGFCFPDTYMINEGEDARAIRDRMVRRFAESWKSVRAEERDSRSKNLSPLEVVTLASIVEREARAAGEFPRIASVFLNRLRKKMRLQSCATVHYSLGEVWGRPLTYADLDIDSTYNTYRRPGLPPGPIGNPGRAAIEAVLRPAETPDLYFVYRGDGTHEFTATYKEHSKAARKFRQSDPHAALVKGEGDESKEQTAK